MTRSQTWLLRLCAAGLILLLQGPAMLTQEVAWAGMLVTYTHDRGLARGVAETFDGKHPCAMCAKAAAMKARESRGNPAERQREEAARIRLAWAEMLPPKWLRWRNPPGRDLPAVETPRVAVIAGRGREAPGTPPPENA